MSATSPPDTSDTIFSVDTLLKYMGNDDKALAVVCKIVHDATAPGLEPLQRAAAAIGAQRWGDAARVFHSLRGSVGTLGAKRMVRASLQLEVALHEGSHGDIPALLAAFELEYQQVLTQAADWLAHHAPR